MVIRVEIVPGDVREALSGALAAGEDMEDDARAAQAAGEEILECFGTATRARGAFRLSWASRDASGLRAAAVLAHNAGRVSEAAGEFIAMDQDVATRAVQTVSEEGAARVSDTLGLK